VSGTFENPLPHRLTAGELAEERDEVLVSAARAGSADAFAELRSHYSRRLYGTLFRITRNHADTEDALQDTFLRVFTGLRTFEGRSSFYSWARRIAVNSALMMLRKRRSRPEVSFEPLCDEESDFPQFETEDPTPSPEQMFDQRQRYVAILHAVHELKPRLRRAIQIRIAHECSLQEIAQALNMSLAAVKSNLHRARARLGTAKVFKRVESK